MARVRCALGLVVRDVGELWREALCVASAIDEIAGNIVLCIVLIERLIGYVCVFVCLRVGVNGLFVSADGVVSDARLRELLEVLPRLTIPTTTTTTTSTSSTSSSTTESPARARLRCSTRVNLGAVARLCLVGAAAAQRR